MCDWPSQGWHDGRDRHCQHNLAVAHSPGNRGHHAGRAQDADVVAPEMREVTKPPRLAAAARASPERPETKTGTGALPERRMAGRARRMAYAWAHAGGGKSDRPTRHAEAAGVSDGHGRAP